MDTESHPSQSYQKSEGQAAADSDQAIDVRLPEAPNLPPVTSFTPATGGQPTDSQQQE